MKPGRIVVYTVIGLVVAVNLLASVWGRGGAVRPELAVALLLLLVIPIRGVHSGREVTTYSAMLYRVIVRRREDESSPKGFRAQREVQFYPKNFTPLDTGGK